jgi:hypothetical protein
MRRFKVQVTTASDGTATAYSPRVAGKIHSVLYIKDGSNGFADGVDIALTAEQTGENIWTQANVNASATVYPRAPTHSQAGVAATLDGTVAALAPIGIVDKVKIAIVQGGSGKTGAFHILVD